MAYLLLDPFVSIKISHVWEGILYFSEKNSKKY